MSEEETSQAVSQQGKEKAVQQALESLPEIEKPEPVCPVPPEHVQLFQDCCDKYEKGEMSDLDVMIEVARTLKGLKKGE